MAVQVENRTLLLGNLWLMRDRQVTLNGVELEGVRRHSESKIVEEDYGRKAGWSRVSGAGTSGRSQPPARHAGVTLGTSASAAGRGHPTREPVPGDRHGHGVGNIGSDRAQRYRHGNCDRL